MTETYPRARLRFLAEFNPSVPPSVRSVDDVERRVLPMDAIHEFALPSQGDTRPVSSLLSGYSYLEPTDVAYAKVTPCFENGKGLVGSDLDGPTFATTEVTVLRPTRGTNQRFLAYLLQSTNFRSPAIASMTGAGGLKRVSESLMKDLMVPSPPSEEQRLIADYLDHETAEIDAFIAEIEAFSDLLTQRRSGFRERLFGQYVSTTGPAGLRRELREVDSRVGPSASPSDLLSVSISNGVIRWIDRTDDLPKAEDLSKYKKVDAGDLILNRMRAFQGAIGVSKWNGITSPDYAVLRTSPDLDPKFAEHLIRSDRFVQEIKARLRGIGTEDSGQIRTPRISVRDLIRIPVYIPKLSEQQANLDEWDDFETSTAERYSDGRLAVDLARERRAALITAAVTGQIDVTAKNKPAAEQLEDDIAQGLHKES